MRIFSLPKILCECGSYCIQDGEPRITKNDAILFVYCGNMGCADYMIYKAIRVNKVEYVQLSGDAVSGASFDVGETEKQRQQREADNLEKMRKQVNILPSR